MNLYKALEDSLYNIFSDLFPTTTVIFSHESGEEPRGTYIAINVLETDKIGREYDASFVPEVDTTITSKTVHEAFVRFLVIGEDAGEIAYEMEALLHNEATRFVLYQNNLAIMRTSEIRRVPEKRDTKWISYFTYDVVFSFGVTKERPIDYIETVSWNENLYKTKP